MSPLTLSTASLSLIAEYPTIKITSQHVRNVCIHRQPQPHMHAHTYTLAHTYKNSPEKKATSAAMCQNDMYNINKKSLCLIADTISTHTAQI